MRRMSQYQVIRVEKIKGGRGGQLARAAKHNLREQAVPNAVKGEEIEKIRGGSTQEIMARWREAMPDKFRKDAVVGAQYLVTASHERMAMMNRQEQNQYFKSALDFLKEKHGDQNIIAATIHRDERTPHMHVLAVPNVTRTNQNGEQEKRLAYKQFYNGKKDLSKLQTDFHEQVSKRFGMDRGVMYSKAKHIPPKQYYAKIETRLNHLRQDHQRNVIPPLIEMDKKTINNQVKTLRSQHRMSRDEALILVGKGSQQKEAQVIVMESEARRERAEDREGYARESAERSRREAEQVRQNAQKSMEQVRKTAKSLGTLVVRAAYDERADVQQRLRSVVEANKSQLQDLGVIEREKTKAPPRQWSQQSHHRDDDEHTRTQDHDRDRGMGR